MYDKTALRLLMQRYINPGIHKQELSKKLKLGMPSIDYGLKKFNALIKTKATSNQINYYLNYSRPMLTSALTAVEYFWFDTLPSTVKISILDFLNDIRIKPIIVWIFGSYTKNSYTKDSDIDLLLVFQEINDSKQIESIANKINIKTNTNLNPVYLNYIEFIDSIHDLSKTFYRNVKNHR